MGFFYGLVQACWCVLACLYGLYRAVHGCTWLYWYIENCSHLTGILRIIIMWWACTGVDRGGQGWTGVDRGVLVGVRELVRLVRAWVYVGVLEVTYKKEVLRKDRT